MNLLSFKIVEVDFPAGGLTACAEIYIDDRQLIKYIKEIEYPQANRDNEKENAGTYQPLEIETLHSKLINGNVEKNEYGKVQVMICGCGCDECWDLDVEITETESIVTWTNFENTHRQWNYDKLKPFLFDKKQYYSAIESLK